MSALYSGPHDIPEIAGSQLSGPPTPHQLGRLLRLVVPLQDPQPTTAVPTRPLSSGRIPEPLASTKIDPPNSARQLTALSVVTQRIIFILAVILVNASLATMVIYGKNNDIRLAFILLFKTKDYISVAISVWAALGGAIRKRLEQRPEVPRQWILSLIPTYNESEEQISKCISSLRDNDLGKHRQVMVVIMDGKPKNLRSGMSRVVFEEKRPYRNLKYTLVQLHITAGWLHQTAAILIEKAINCGKKDSLILCHDLFNFPRDNMPSYSRRLREDMWETVLPALIPEHWQGFQGFDYVFCTDADSKLHKGCLRLLADALAIDPNAIAAAGTVFVELEPGFEWSFWNLHQQFQVRCNLRIQYSGRRRCSVLTISGADSQYTFSQFVRRRAEGYIGKVTCLPGCVTMIAVRKEMAGAIQKYASPVTSKFVLQHQVQNLARPPATPLSPSSPLFIPALILSPPFTGSPPSG